MDSQGWKISKRLIEYFNQRFELYGRKVVIEPIAVQGRRVDELKDEGQQQACIDAARIAERGYFGVLYQSNAAGAPAFPSTPFSECAAREHLFIPLGPTHVSEELYERWHPYVWQISPSCDTVGASLSHYVGKRLRQDNAVFAGDAIKSRTRSYGIYHPENTSFKKCADVLVQKLWDEFSIRIEHKISYPLDLPLLGTHAQRSAREFKEKGVTTLLALMDVISLQLMTHSATTIDWHPEWVITGVDCQDCENGARGCNQVQADGHMFGQASVFDQTRALAESSEVVRVARALGLQPTGKFAVYYFETIDLFTKLQAGGPQLSSENIARGLAVMGPTGSDSAAWGRWDYTKGHTAVNSFREVYWKLHSKGPDGDMGAWISTEGGRWFRPAEWPSGTPNIYG